MRIHRAAAALSIALALAIAPSDGHAQENDPLQRDLRVFLDCTDFDCDDDYFVEEIPWVDFVRDREAADIHVLGTAERTGGGGSAYTLEFIGRGRFEGRNSRLGLVNAPDATEDDRRRSLVRLVRLGLAAHALETSRGPLLDIAFEGGGVDGQDPVAQEDPWNHWVFRARMNSFVNGESRQNFANLNSSFSASRVTDAWKHSISLSGSYNRDYFEFEQLDSMGTVIAADTIVSVRRSHGFNALHVKSISPHWSVGAQGSWRMSDFVNQDVHLRLMPAVEFSVFPYSEASRRQFTFLYSVGPAYYDYQEVTLFERSHEAVLRQQLVASYDVTQPWGSVDVTVGASHFLAQLDDGPGWPDPQYSVTTYTEFDVRIFRGLSANAWGGIDWVRDQIHLPAGGQTEREILLRQRELATSYRYFAQLGLSYSFGSIYSPVVNTRLEAL